MSSTRRLLAHATLAAVLAPIAASAADAQSLRGSRASVARAHRVALALRLPFFEATGELRAAARRGELVALAPSRGTYRVHRVVHPYVRPVAHRFVERLAARYRAACDEPLVVTSAARPSARQPANSSRASVHPAGIAVDLRKPPAGRCRTWLRTALLALERDGVIEATEEFNPPHFHVAVLGAGK